MFRRHDCITDPTARAWWREYRQMCRDGNPLGLSFVEFVAHRLQPQQTYTEATAAPWYVAICGHRHQWGQPCSEMAATT